MSNIPSFIRRIAGSSPPYSLLIAIGILLLLLFLFVLIIRRTRILRMAELAMTHGEKNPRMTAKLLSRPSLIEALIRRKGDQAAVFFGLSEHLIHKFKRHRNAEEARRLLALPSGEGLFPVFLVALHDRSIAQVFSNWLKENQEIPLLRQVAFSAWESPYDVHKAGELLAQCAESLRELAVHPEWQVRYFAFQILLTDNNAQTNRLMKGGFNDPHPLIRRIVAQKIRAINHEYLFQSLMRLVLDDPVPEVRRYARERIEVTFPDRWKLDLSQLNTLQLLHVMELLTAGSNEDENTAITALKGASNEVRLPAARFLENSGTLKRILKEAHRQDREDWNRRKDLLSKALSVGVSGFLELIRSADSIDILLLGAELLMEGGDSSLITFLTEKVFTFHIPIRDADKGELYRRAVNLACKRGDRKTLLQVQDELRKHRHNKVVLDYILPMLPLDEAASFRDVLLTFLKDSKFPAEEAFLSAISQLTPSLLLQQVLDILEADRSQFTYTVRLRALRILGSWRLDYTLETIIENLPLLPAHLFKDFSHYLDAMDSKTLKERTAYILSTPDAKMRAALISCLPVPHVCMFSRRITEGLHDTDPDIRIACFKALMDAGELQATESALALLRDPLERVRKESAYVTGIGGSDQFLDALEALLLNPEESFAVRKAALDGLSASSSTESIGIMLRFLDSSADMRQECVAALSCKTDEKAIQTLFEYYQKAGALLRDRIIEVFVAMEENGEEIFAALLKKRSPSLNSSLAELLQKTGFVETLIRKLGHRAIQERREAIEVLAEIPSESASRGIALALRDPDEKIRIKAKKALKSLEKGVAKQ